MEVRSPTTADRIGRCGAAGLPRRATLSKSLLNLPLKDALQLVHLSFERGSPKAEPAASGGSCAISAKGRRACGSREGESDDDSPVRGNSSSLSTTGTALFAIASPRRRHESDALRTSIAKACRALGIPLWSPHDLRHWRISLLHLKGVPWVRIGEQVGQRDLAVTANTYSHVMLDEGGARLGELLT